ncbi:MAG: flagellar assembly protein FliH [Thalassolituus sp.]
MPDSKRDRPIPAENVETARPWRLPFWTEAPAYAVEREADDEVIDETEENTIPYPTAEELEAIRRDAYNDGLEQGLVEGRQQGKADGFSAGFEEGQKEGRVKGQQEGKTEGNRLGYEEGKASGAADVAEELKRLRQIVSTIQASLIERDRQLPDVMVMLLSRLAEQVLGHELRAGAPAIARYVKESIALLPDGEDIARVYVAEDDYTLAHDGAPGISLQVDPTLTPGECRVESQNSLVEYSVSDHLQQALLSMAEQMLTAAGDFPTERETQMPDSTDVPEPGEIEPPEPDEVPEPSTAEVSDTEVPDSEAGDSEVDDGSQ